MDENFFNAGLIDFSLKKIIEGDVSEQVRGFRTSLKSFRKEIVFWFDLLKSANTPNRSYLKKPICIELFEYTQYLSKLRGIIQNVIVGMNKLFREKNRPPPLTPLPKEILHTLKDIRKYLNDPRNRLAAHRYTLRTGEFLTYDEIIKLLSKLSDEHLIKIKDELFNIHDVLESWFNKNRGFIDVFSSSY